MKCAAIIPAFNATETILPVLQRLAKHVSAEDIFVVDDGSSDDTAAKAETVTPHVLRHGHNLGKGAALRTGFNAVLGEGGYGAAFTLDADLQHDPDDCPAFLTEWRNGKAQVLVGVRRKLGSAMPVHRRLSNGITSFLVSARTGQSILDSQSGFRLISTEVLSKVTTESQGFEAETEFLIKASLKGFTIGFVPIATIYGTAGSHMTPLQTTKKFLNVLLKEY